MITSGNLPKLALINWLWSVKATEDRSSRLWEKIIKIFLLGKEEGVVYTLRLMPLGEGRTPQRSWIMPERD